MDIFLLGGGGLWNFLRLKTRFFHLHQEKIICYRCNLLLSSNIEHYQKISTNCVKNLEILPNVFFMNVNINNKTYRRIFF